MFWKINRDARRWLSFRLEGKSTAEKGVENSSVFQNTRLQSHDST